MVRPIWEDQAIRSGSAIDRATRRRPEPKRGRTAGKPRPAGTRLIGSHAWRHAGPERPPCAAAPRAPCTTTTTHVTDRHCGSAKRPTLVPEAGETREEGLRRRGFYPAARGREAGATQRHSRLAALPGYGFLCM